MIKQFSIANISFEFFDAIDLRFVDDEVIQDLVTTDRNGSIKRPLVKAEVGCALSHIKCLENFISSGSEYALIVEDDADISRLNKDIIYQLIANMPSDVVILGYSKVSLPAESSIYRHEPIYELLSIGGYRFGPVFRDWTCGTVAYLIKRQAAQSVIDMLYVANNNKVTTVADDWRYISKASSLSIAHSRPLLVLERFEEFDSSIESSRRDFVRSRFKKIETLRLLRGYIRMIILQLRHKTHK